MSAGQQANEQPLDHRALADDDLLHLGENGIETSAHLADGAVDFSRVDGHAAPRLRDRRRGATQASPPPVLLYPGLASPTTGSPRAPQSPSLQQPAHAAPPY